MQRAERLILGLCDEIDEWRELAAHWKTKYEELNEKYNNVMDSSIKASQRASLGMLAIALDDEGLAKAVAGEESNGTI
jgi:hypothetical protein